MKFLQIISAVLILSVCAIFCPAEENKNVLYQYSVFRAIEEGNYDGSLTLKEIRKKGDFGFAILNQLNGEMVMLDGQMYKIGSDGSLMPAEEDEESPFCEVTYFEADKSLNAQRGMGLRQMKSFLGSELSTKNVVYALKVTGAFEYVKIRRLSKQEKPYQKLQEVIEKGTEEELKNIEGTLVGFKHPQFMEGINTPEYHFYFLSDDRKTGGYLLDIAMRKAKIEIGYLNKIELDFPKDKDYYRLDLSVKPKAKKQKKTVE